MTKLRHCEEPATRQSSGSARKGTADSFTATTGLPRSARNDGEGARNDQDPSLRGACDVAIQQPTSRHCEEPATWQSSRSARKGTADSFTAATGLPRFARNDGEGARNDGVVTRNNGNGPQ
jgi:hypothetical protein